MGEGPWPGLLGGLSIIAAISLVVWLGDHAPYDSWAPFVVAVAIWYGMVVLLRSTAAATGDPLMLRILWAGLGMKALSVLVRYYIAFDLYGGNADAGRYHGGALLLQEKYRNGQFSLSGSGLEPFGDETRIIAVFLGAVYTALGAHQMVGFFAFALFGFIGQVLFLRAFVVGVEHGLARRYAALVLFLPSLLFWPAAAGKEAWMVLCLGMASLGAAHLLGPQPRVRGAAYLVLGLGGALLVRPHVAAIVLLAMVPALLTRRPQTSLIRSTATRVVLVVVLVPLSLVAVSRLNQFFGVEKFNLSTVNEVLGDVRQQTEIGGSQFVAQPVTSPADFPNALASVLLRPFPPDAASAPLIAASAESLVLVGLAVAFRKSLRQVPRALMRSPYITFALSYGLLFTIAFSNISNSGILARQRTQVLPLLLVLLALGPNPVPDEGAEPALSPPARRSPPR